MMTALRMIAAGLLFVTVNPQVVRAAEPDALSALPRHIKVDERLHVSGQPSAEALTKLGAAGIRTVIDLRPDAETPDLDERAVVEKSGVAYRSLPVSGTQDLTRENVAKFDQLLQEADAGKVLMHCGSGNRVGAIMALRAHWLQGKSAEEALAIGKGAGLTGLEGEVKVLLHNSD
jgi:uncharacterized protein (TIGR01244 family)